MALRTTLRGKGQLTIPAEIRGAARLDDGDVIEFEMTDDGILLRPLKVIDSTQAWFWTAEWQSGEMKAESDKAAGRYERYEDGDDFLASFDG